MKTSTHLFAIGSLSLSLSLSLTVCAQAPPPSAPESARESASFQIAERGPHHRTWQKILTTTDARGRVVSRTNLAYVELSTGLHYLEDGQWQEAQELIESYPDGAIARQGAHRVIFANNLNVAGAVDLQMPDGRRLRSHVVGLSYFDSGSGRSVLLGRVKDALGVLVESNRVLYADAFEGLTADVRYTYRLAGLEQDVILRERPPSPELWGLNPATTRLQVLTEFDEAPQPLKERRAVRVGGVELSDEEVDFGPMRIGMGRAFGVDAGEPARFGGVPVVKGWVSVRGRTFLLEEVVWRAVEGQLRALPAAASSSTERPVGLGENAVAGLWEALPRPVVARARAPIQVAQAVGIAGPAWVLDYALLSGATNFIFKADTTYFCSGTVNLFGKTVIEGGAVIKFATNQSATVIVNDELVCRTGPYRIAFFTACDDDTVGETISGSTGNPTGYYGWAGLVLPASVEPPTSVRYAQFRFLQCGLDAGLGGLFSLENLQFVRCAYPFALSGGDHGLFNVLVEQAQTVFYGGGSVAATHLTVDRCQTLADDYHQYGSALSLVNSLLVGVTNWGNYAWWETNATAALASGQGVFQSVGAGAHYLTANSPFRNAGLTNLAASHRAALQRKTTWPPVGLSGPQSGALMLSPQAQRDTDQPDLGYHYEPLDYLLSGVILTNSTLGVEAGTAIASYTNSVVVWLTEGGTVQAEGSPTSPIWWARCQLVQEQPAPIAPGTLTINSYHTGESTPTGRFRFCRFSSPANGGHHLYHDTDWAFASLLVRDCEFWGGQNSFKGARTGGASLLNLWNNLFYRSRADALAISGISSSAQLTASNNMVVGVSVTWRQPAGATWQAHDNVFQECSFSAFGSVVSNSHNAYINCNGQFANSQGGDVLLGNFVWTNGPLGEFYQVSTNLWDAGSVGSAQAGLYHYTVLLDQQKETNSPVDIGYHYVAVDENGQPLDSDGDGIPDWRDEDSDGDDLPDAWEWQYFGDLNQTGVDDPDFDDLTNAQEYQLGTNPNNWDTDGDGLSDSEELEIPVDINTPGLGYLSPLSFDTANTGIPDGRKDADHDGISNLGELRDYGSDPANPRSFNPSKVDSEYFHSAKLGDVEGLSMAYLSVADLGGGLLEFSISGAFPGAVYDLYFVNSILAQRWQWRRVFSGIECNAAGQAIFRLQQPDPVQGYFVVLSAEDRDEDGLSDGYEAWFTYSGLHTVLDNKDSDGDGLHDGWEAAYGLNPTDQSGANGADGDPDNDFLENVLEFDPNSEFRVPSYDPLKPYGSTATPARPVVWVSSSDQDAYRLGDPATVTFHRSIGEGANLNSPLTVYYSVGGTARYEADYLLSPAPPEYPRIFSATIPAGQDSVTVTVTPTGAGLHQAGTQIIVIKLTPYAVSPVPQVQNPLDWAYVVDLFRDTVLIRIHDGILINLEKTSSGHLRIKPLAETSPLPFINVAKSDRGTMARIYAGKHPSTDPSKVIGEYRTSPYWGDPSRTSVDRYGNVWLGNRAIGFDGGGITKIGIVIGGTRCDAQGNPDPEGQYLKPPFIYNTCLDRHGETVMDEPDGLIKTSRAGENILDWSDQWPGDQYGGVSLAEDEAILQFVRVYPDYVRSVAVDSSNNVWVGSRYNLWQELVEGDTGVPITGWRLHFEGGGYGGLIDGSGVVWSSGFDNSPANARLIQFAPGSQMPVLTGGNIPRTGDNYGIGIDPNTGDVWQGRWQQATVVRFDSGHCTTSFGIGEAQNRGIVVDGSENVWVGGSGREIRQLNTSGRLVRAIYMRFTRRDGTTVDGHEPIGVTVDHLGTIWAICRGAQEDNWHGWAMRVDPLGGQVVEAVDLGVSAPYNYSDMTGFVLLSTTQPAGVWDYVRDSGNPDTVWSSLSMDALIPTGTRIIVEVRAANRITALPSWPFRPVVNAQGVTPPGTTALPPGVKGRYLEVRVNLLRDFGVTDTPELRNLTVQSAAAACALDITTHPRSQAVAAGDSATFEVTVQVPAGAAATYQWLKDGAVIPGATAATLTLNNVNYTHAGRYSVKVGATTGCGSFQLESAPARLHVKGNPPDAWPYVWVSDYGETVRLTAYAQVPANSIPGEKPIRYQWRFNNAPIPGASGDCGDADSCGPELFVTKNCTNSGQYSVVFWNEYGQNSTTNAGVFLIDPPVYITPAEVHVQDPNQEVVLEAIACLGQVACVRWYLWTSGGWNVIPPNPPPEDPTNLLKYKVPTPITETREYRVVVTDPSWNEYEATAKVLAP